MRTIQLLLMIGVLCPLLCAGKANQDKVDAYMAEVSKRYEIPGSALVVIQDGKVVCKRFYGQANLESNKIVDDQTLFKLHSLSKVFVATSVFQLIEEHKLSLTDEISKYLQGLPETWKKVRIEHLLSHSSGLPDIIRYEAASESEHRAKVFEGDIEFQPGARFQYNQTNFWLLNKIIAKVTKTSLQNFLITNQFLGEKDAIIFSGNTNAKNRANEYFLNKHGIMEVKEFHVPEYMYGAAGIALTLDNFIKWNQALDNNSLLLPDTKKLMWKPFPFGNGHNFAYGWGIEKVNDRRTIGFSGGGIVSLRKYVEDNMTVIFLSNGFRHFPNVNNISNYIAGLMNENLKDERIFSNDVLVSAFLLEPFNKAVNTYHRVKKNNMGVNFEGTLNSIGYSLVRRDRISDAITVFKLNAEENPNSWNVWDSLAEAYESAGEKANAILNYEKSVFLNPENTNGLKKLNELREN